jgi:hypothetical protein
VSAKYALAECLKANKKKVSFYTHPNFPRTICSILSYFWWKATQFLKPWINSKGPDQTKFVGRFRTNHIHRPFLSTSDIHLLLFPILFHSYDHNVTVRPLHTLIVLLSLYLQHIYSISSITTFQIEEISMTNGIFLVRIYGSQIAHSRLSWLLKQDQSRILKNNRDGKCYVFINFTMGYEITWYSLTFSDPWWCYEVKHCISLHVQNQVQHVACKPTKF